MIEKEATAIMWALKKWEHFLHGGHFLIETDHRPLQFIESNKDNMSKLGRMAVRLQEYRPFDINHIDGKTNYEADYLSRFVGAIELNYEELDDIYARRQRSPTDFVQDTEGRWRFVGDGNNRLAIPASKRNEILRTLHDDLAHFGIERMLPEARKRFLLAVLGT